MTTKSKISKAFRSLEKIGWLVFNWSYKKAVPSGSKGWVDIVLIHALKIRLIFIEIKIKETKDKFGLRQIILREVLLKISDFLINLNIDFLYYFIVDESNYQDIIQKILEE